MGYIYYIIRRPDRPICARLLGWRQSSARGSRMSGFFSVLIVLAGLATLGALFIGIFGMARGGEFNKKHGNRIMRLRVILQFSAIILIALSFIFSDR